VQQKTVAYTNAVYRPTNFADFGGYNYTRTIAFSANIIRPFYFYTNNTSADSVIWQKTLSSGFFAVG